MPPPANDDSDDNEFGRPKLSRNFKIKGVQFEGRWKYVKENIVAGERAWLVREKNERDIFAIAVLDGSGVKLGYVDADVNQDLHERLAAGWLQDAKIARLYGGGEFAAVQAYLFAPEFAQVHDEARCERDAPTPRETPRKYKKLGKKVFREDRGDGDDEGESSEEGKSGCSSCLLGCAMLAIIFVIIIHFAYSAEASRHPKLKRSTTEAQVSTEPAEQGEPQPKDQPAEALKLFRQRVGVLVPHSAMRLSQDEDGAWQMRIEQEDAAFTEGLAEKGMASLRAEAKAKAVEGLEALVKILSENAAFDSKGASLRIYGRMKNLEGEEQLHWLGGASYGQSSGAIVSHESP